MTLKHRVHDMIAKKSTKAEIEKMLRTDFKFADLHIQRSLDGMMIEFSRRSIRTGLAFSARVLGPAAPCQRSCCRMA